MPQIEIDSEAKPSRWPDLDIKTVLLVLTLIVSWAGSYFSMSARVEDQSRRVTLLEQQLVPRTESAVRDAALSDRLRSIETALHDINARLLDLKDAR